MHRHDAAFVVDLAKRVFADPVRAQEWLNRASVQLGGRAPIEVIATEEGARRVEELLAQIDDDGRMGVD